MNTRVVVAAFAVVAGLSGCGGSGGNREPARTPPVHADPVRTACVKVDDAMVALLNSDRSTEAFQVAINIVRAAGKTLPGDTEDAVKVSEVLDRLGPSIFDLGASEDHGAFPNVKVNATAAVLRQLKTACAPTGYVVSTTDLYTLPVG